MLFLASLLATVLFSNGSFGGILLLLKYVLRVLMICVFSLAASDSMVCVPQRCLQGDSNITRMLLHILLSKNLSNFFLFFLRSWS